jgi:hypothetical protein
MNEPAAGCSARELCMCCTIRARYAQRLSIMQAASRRMNAKHGSTPTASLLAPQPPVRQCSRSTASFPLTSCKLNFDQLNFDQSTIHMLRQLGHSNVVLTCTWSWGGSWVCSKAADGRPAKVDARHSAHSTRRQLRLSAGGGSRWWCCWCRAWNDGRWRGGSWAGWRCGRCNA